MPQRIEHADLPGEIIVSYEKLHDETNLSDKDLKENINGTLLIRKIAEIYFSEPEIEVITKKYEKPRAFVNGNEISVSFSHTRDALSLGMSKQYNVGCDMESIERKVSPLLIDRVRCITESEELYKHVKPIQIWTLKEAALKMIGTGLRKPMNSVSIKMIDLSNFDVEFSDGKRAKICSFQHQNHWISICYHN